MRTALLLGSVVLSSCLQAGGSGVAARSQSPSTPTSSDLPTVTPPTSNTPPASFVPAPLRAGHDVGTASVPMVPSARMTNVPSIPLKSPEVLPVPRCALPPGATGAEAHPSAHSLWLARKNKILAAAERCQGPHYHTPKNLSAGFHPPIASPKPAITGASGFMAAATAPTGPTISQVRVATCCQSDTGATSATVTILGSGFGHDPVIAPPGGCYIGWGETSPDLAIWDATQGWGIGCVTIGIDTWNDSMIVVDYEAYYGQSAGGRDFWFKPGDSVTAWVTNPQTGVQTASTPVTVGATSSTPSTYVMDAVRDCACNAANPSKGGPFNTRTGNLYTSVTDLSVNPPGPTLDWTRTYNSQATGDADYSNSLGYGWQVPYTAHLVTASMLGGEPGNVIIANGQGNRQRFVDEGNGQFQAFPGVYATLVGNSDGTYTETMADQSTITFNAAGQATTMIDGHGGALTLTYNASGFLSQVTDSHNAARFLALDYYANGTQIQDVRDGTGRTVGYSYDANGNLQQVTDVMGRTTSYQYNNNLLTETDNSLGQPVEKNTYDVYSPAGRVISQTEQDGSTLSIDYESDHTTVTTTGSTGTVTDTTVYQYDPNRNVLTGEVRNGVTVDVTQFDQNMEPSVFTDANNHTTQVISNALGQQTSVTDPLSGTSTVQYDTLNRPITATDTLGRVTTFSYDPGSNLNLLTQVVVTGQISSTRALTATYAYYSGTSQLKDKIDTDGVDTHYAYDAANQLTDMTIGYNTPLAQTTHYGYDAAGRQTAITSGYGTPLARDDITTYNADNTVARTVENCTDASGAPVSSGCASYDAQHPDRNVTTSYGYDGDGRQVWVRDTLGHYTVTHYNDLGQIDWTVKNLQPVTLDGNGNPIIPATPPAFLPSQTDANVATLFGYDDVGRTQLITQTGILTGTFTPATRSFSAATTRTTKYDYDSLGRLAATTLNYQPGTPVGPDVNVQTTNTYDAQGNLTWTRDALGRWTETLYDALNRPYETIANYENGNPNAVDPANRSWTDGDDTDIITYTSYNPDSSVNQSIDN